MKKVMNLLGIFAVIGTLFFVFTAERKLNGEWVQSGDQWRYQHEDGTFAKNTWKMIDGQKYHFNEEGWMEKGWIEVEGEKYYLDNDGKMLTDSFTPDGFYVNAEGHIVNDELMQGDGISYTFNGDLKDKSCYLRKCYYGIPTCDEYVLHEGKVLEAIENVLTPEILSQINLEKIEENTIMLNYENFQEGYQFIMKEIGYSETTKTPVVLIEYKKIVDGNEGDSCGGTSIVRRYNLETGKLIATNESKLK